MDNYPSNSHKAKETAAPQKAKGVEPKKVEKIVTGDVTRKKKSLSKRFSETFVGGDARSVWSYVAIDVMIPAAKDMVSDAVSQGVERMLFGESRPRSRVGSRSGGRTNYHSPTSGLLRSREREDPRREIMSRRARANHNFDDIVLGTRAEAEEVIDAMFAIIAEYDMVTVADLYTMVDEPGNFMDEKWGWTDFRGAGVTRVKGGYLLDLPRPEPLD